MNEAVVFLHIPRTGGTTLNRITERIYPREAIYSFGSNAGKSIAVFKSLDEKRRAEIQLLRGHMAFGLHEWLPKPASYITILRNPLDRVVSFYYYVLQTPQHPLREVFEKEGIKLADLPDAEFLRMINNGQTRLISGVWNDIPFGECTESMLEVAKRRLRDDFAVVGLTERFDETLLLLKWTLGWNTLWYTRENATRHRPRTRDISSDTIDNVLGVNSLDVELYRYAVDLFKDKMRKVGPQFGAKRVFEVRNWGVKNLCYRLRSFSVRSWWRAQMERWNRASSERNLD